VQLVETAGEGFAHSTNLNPSAPTGFRSRRPALACQPRRRKPYQAYHGCLVFGWVSLAGLELRGPWDGAFRGHGAIHCAVHRAMWWRGGDASARSCLSVALQRGRRPPRHIFYGSKVRWSPTPAGSSGRWSSSAA